MATIRTHQVAATKNKSSRGSFDSLRSLRMIPILAVCVVMLLTGCRAKPTLTRQEAEGKHLYEVRCAHCHEENDLALKKVPPDLHGVFAGKTLPSGAAASDIEVRRVVLAGKGMMPAFTGRFTEEQMGALLAYLHTGLR
ncbi:MAG: cytochrome c [Terracidiphilus sp.]